MKAQPATSSAQLAERPVLTEVRLTLQPMLRIQGCSLEDPACVVKGELMGLEIESGVLEITNCYSCQNISAIRPVTQVPPDSSTEQTTNVGANAALRDGAAREEKTLEKFRNKVRDLYDSTDADPQALGIWSNECPSDLIPGGCNVAATGSPDTSGSSINNLLEELYERCLTLEPNTILLTFNLSLYQIGEFAYKAYRLADAWYNLRHQLDRGEVDKAAYQKSVAALQPSDLLTPVRCVPSLTPYDQAAALICHPSAEARLEKDRLVQEAMLQARERELTKINYALENVISTN